MIKVVISFVLLFAAVSSFAQAGDWKSWYQNLVKGLKSRVEHRLESRTRVAAVAAVRGARQGEDPAALYWKGGASDKARQKLDDEKRKLADAAQLVVDGRTAEGKAALRLFISENPDSVYLRDAQEALKNLPAEAAPPESPGKSK